MYIFTSKNKVDDVIVVVGVVSPHKHEEASLLIITLSCSLYLSLYYFNDLKTPDHQDKNIKKRKNRVVFSFFILLNN